LGKADGGLEIGEAEIVAEFGMEETLFRPEAEVRRFLAFSA